MVNILIADDNINYAVNLMNCINRSNENIKVCNIAKNGKETLEILNKKNNIDVILLDYKMPFYNGEEILDNIIDKDKYINSIILISGEVESVIKLAPNEMIYSIAYKNMGIDKILENINKLLEDKEIIKMDYLYKKRLKMKLYI